MKHLNLTFLFVALLVVPGLVHAQSFAPTAKRGSVLITDLGLRGSTKQKSRVLLSAARKVEIRLHADIEIAGIDLRTELDKDAPNEKVVSALIESISSFEGKLRRSRVVTWIRVRKLLNLRQRRQLRSLRNDDGRNIVKTQGEFINPFDTYQTGSGQAPGQSDVINPFAESKRKNLRRGYGEVNIRSAKAAKIYVDGRRVGVTPVSTRLTLGKHRIRAVFIDGSPAKTRNVIVKSGAKLAVGFGDQDQSGLLD